MVKKLNKFIEKDLKPYAGSRNYRSVKETKLIDEVIE